MQLCHRASRHRCGASAGGSGNVRRPHVVPSRISELLQPLTTCPQHLNVLSSACQRKPRICQASLRDTRRASPGSLLQDIGKTQVGPAQQPEQSDLLAESAEQWTLRAIIADLRTSTTPLSSARAVRARHWQAMGPLNYKYSLYGKALPPRPIRVKNPGWGGEPQKMVDGSEPQPWHCLPFVEGSTWARTRLSV